MSNAENTLLKPVKRSINYQQVVLLGILIIFCILFGSLTSRFISSRNIINLTRQVAFVIITGAGVTLLMISGHIDLSVGSTIALSGVAYAMMSKGGVPTFPAMMFGVIVGMAIGLINSLIVVKLKITPFIGTLGTMYIMRGLTRIITDSRTVREGLAENFTAFGRGMVGPIPVPLFVIVIVVIIFLFLEKKSTLGRYAVAIGGNRTAATLSGINIQAYVSNLYIIVGILAGLTGVLMASRLGVGEPNVGIGFEFDVIIAIILGGTSLAGGTGSIIGMVVGALIVGVISNGLNLLNVLSFYQSIIKGVLLVCAVLLDQVLKRKLKNGNR